MIHCLFQHTYVCTQLWSIPLHKQQDSTAVWEKKLVQMWFTVITHPSLSTGLFLQCIDSGGVWGDLKEAHLNLDKSDFSLGFQSRYVQFFAPTKQFLKFFRTQNFHLPSDIKRLISSSISWLYHNSILVITTVAESDYCWQKGHISRKDDTLQSQTGRFQVLSFLPEEP